MRTLTSKNFILSELYSNRVMSMLVIHFYKFSWILWTHFSHGNSFVLFFFPGQTLHCSSSEIQAVFGLEAVTCCTGRLCTLQSTSHRWGPCKLCRQRKIVVFCQRAKFSKIEGSEGAGWWPGFIYADVFISTLKHRLLSLGLEWSARPSKKLFIDSVMLCHPDKCTLSNHQLVMIRFPFSTSSRPSEFHIFLI